MLYKCYTRNLFQVHLNYCPLHNPKISVQRYDFILEYANVLSNKFAKFCVSCVFSITLDTKLLSSQNARKRPLTAFFITDILRVYVHTCARWSVPCPEQHLQKGNTNYKQCMKSGCFP